MPIDADNTPLSTRTMALSFTKFIVMNGAKMYVLHAVMKRAVEAARK